MHERNLLYFPKGASGLVDGSRRSGESTGAIPLVLPETIAHVARSTDRNVTLIANGNQLYDQMSNRFTTRAPQISREYLHGKATRLTTKVELLESKSSPAYQSWQESRAKLQEILRKSQTVYVPVEVIPGETIPGQQGLPQQATIAELPTAPRHTLSPDDPIVDDFITMERRNLLGVE